MAATGDDASLYALKFTDRLVLLTQQMEMRIPQLFEQGDYRGFEGGQAIDQLAPQTIEQSTIRFQDMTPDMGVFDSRWVYPDADFDRSIWRSNFDKIRSLVDTAPAIGRDLVAAMNRQKDLTCINSFFADAKTGKTGQNTTSFNTASTVANAGNRVVVNFNAAANTGLTVEKLIEAHRFLYSNEVDLDNENPNICITAAQEADLFRQAQVVSSDFNSMKVLPDGRIKSFMGFNFIHSEQLPTSSANIRRCPVWVKSGMHFGTWMDVRTDISEIKHKRGLPWRIYVMATFGATRLEEKRVAEILCSEV
jgi:hypothetical protein